MRIPYSTGWRRPGRDWRIYFHDIAQSATLTRLWGDALTGFQDFEESFARDAAAGKLPAYSFIEPRYFPDTLTGQLPNDEHPPHNVAYGEELIAAVYNAVRSGPGWQNTLLVITYDEHGGCYDHVVPPAATSPGGPNSDGFAFDRFGVRVPAVIVSPYVKAGSVLRPAGKTPFDHTSIIATLRKLFGLAALTPRDAAAPDLLELLTAQPDNAGPASVVAPAIPPATEQVARAGDKPLNSLQECLTTLAVQLPTAHADIDAHVRRLSTVSDLQPLHANAADAGADVTAHMQAFTGAN